MILKGFFFRISDVKKGYCEVFFGGWFNCYIGLDLKMFIFGIMILFGWNVGKWFWVDVVEGFFCFVSLM